MHNIKSVLRRRVRTIAYGYGAKQALDKEWVKKLPALAPVNIIVAEFASNLAYWQPTMRSAFS